MVLGRNNRVYQIIGAIVLLIVLAGTYAYAGLGVGNSNVKACKNFCSVATAEYDKISGGDCYCLTTNSQVDIQNNRVITVQASLNAGKIRAVDIISPIPANIQQQIQEQLKQQQLLQQQQSQQTTTGTTGTTTQ